ncbi:MAG: hypothetical protein R8M38_02795 [Mariprofundaceae bacterium]
MISNIGSRAGDFAYKNNTIPIIAVLTTISVAWLGFFDAFAEEYINNAIKNAAIIYGVARGINGIVSLIQSIDISVVVVSASVGELLDPINDIVERFSAVMTYSIISLTLQKVLLVMLKGSFFSALLTIFGLTWLLLRIKKNRYATASFKAFLTLVFIRLSLSLVLILNMAVDNFFIKENVSKEQATVELMESEMHSLYSEMKSEGISDNPQQIDDVETKETERQLISLEEQRVSLNDEVIQQEKHVKKIRAEIRRLNPNRGVIESTLHLFNDDRPELSAKKIELKPLESALNELEEQLVDLDERIKNTKDSIECTQKKHRGESCSLFDKVTKSARESVQSIASWDGLKPIENFIDKINVITDKSKEWFSSILTLLTLVVLKSILLPLLFWFAMFKVIKQLWGIERAY